MKKKRECQSRERVMGARNKPSKERMKVMRDNGENQDLNMIKDKLRQTST